VKPPRKKIFFGKYILLALGILLFSLSVIFNKVYRNRSSVANEVRMAQQYLEKHDRDFRNFLRDTQLIKQMIRQKETLGELETFTAKPYGIFLYTVNAFGETTLNAWTDQAVLPEPEWLVPEKGEFFLPLPNGRYHLIREALTGLGKYPAVIAIAMIPVQSEYFIETDYLPKEFKFSSTADKTVVISEEATDFPVRSPSGNILFYLNKKKFSAVPYNDTTTILLRFCGLLLMLFFFHLLAVSVSVVKGNWKGIGMLAGILVLLRIITYFYPELLNLRQFELFDPRIYGSSTIHRSLGDLLINAVLFCWIVLFAWSRLRHQENLSARFPGWLKWVSGLLSLFLLIYSTFILATVVRSLIADSKISFDVTDFFSLDRHTIAGFAALAFLSLSYYYFSLILFRFIFPLLGNRPSIIYFAIGVAGLLYLTARSGRPEVLFYIPVLLWLLAYTWLISRRGVLVSTVRINMTGIVSWLFIFSVSIAAIMLTENQRVEWEKRKRMAGRIAEQTDPSSETLLSIAMEFLDNEFLSENFYRFRDPEDGEAFRDSIVTNNYKGYLNKYDTRLYVYDSSRRPLYNDDPTTYESLNTILNVQSKPTQKDGLFYYETSYDKFNYITRREVTDTSTGEKQGTLFIVSNPKNFSNEALFPELFRQYRGNDPENSPIYSIAVYGDGKLVSPPGNYPFATTLTEEETPKDEYIRVSREDYDELWYRAGNKKVVVIARKKETTIETITLFSYIFCSFLLLVGLVRLAAFMVKAFYRGNNWGKMLQWNIRTQVHSTIIFVSIFSFLIIGFATISFFISRYNRSNSDKLSRTMKIMVNEMEKKMADHSTFDDVIKLYDSVSVYELQKLVDEVSDIHGVDVNVYDLDGDLQVTSEANVYTKGVLSKKMDPEAFYHLNRLRQIQHAQEESIGNFSFLSIYSPVRDDQKQVYAYINIPYFTSKSELRQEISNFLVTIINLNAFIFLIAGLIALFITNRITRSFSFISEKMKEVNLGKMNEEIIWKRDDEIGGLVKEYNKMVAKLEESATALAKSEREGAWREMARQVAHEIKNPLTPMKLSIQYLQKAIDSNQPNVKELSSSVAHTLVEQIDHLSKIAADFSQFANIGNTNVTSFDLHEVLGSLKELYSSDERVEFLWRPVHRQVQVEADKTQMNRLFTNLFANAVEACNGSPYCRIEVEEQVLNGKIRISVRDNGEGIPPDMRSRIFVPNFTTKSSGTGLGLAMCKSIVEQAHGEIWFETEPGNGTSFYVELPVSNN